MSEQSEPVEKMTFPKPEDVKDIFAAINAIMQRVEYVQKQKSAKLSYSFAGEAALISAIRPWMVYYGVILSIINVEDFREREYVTGSGTGMLDATLKMTGRFVHAPSGTYLDAVAYGQGADAGDKSTNKASTGAFKYLLRQTFVIETGDDPDSTQDNERGKQGQSSGQSGQGQGTQPGNGHNKPNINPPAAKIDYQGWPEKMIEDLATIFAVKKEQVLTRLTGCALPKIATKEALVEWIKFYKAVIATGATQTVAVEKTNQALAPLPAPNAADNIPF